MSDVLNFDETCLFCKIIKGDIPSAKVYEDALCYAFRDINPQAPTHILVVPKVHMRSVAEVSPNCGPDACQSVPHLHFHILGGAKLGERMA